MINKATLTIAILTLSSIVTAVKIKPGSSDHGFRQDGENTSDFSPGASIHYFEKDGKKIYQCPDIFTSTTVQKGKSDQVVHTSLV